MNRLPRLHLREFALIVFALLLTEPLTDISFSAQARALAPQDEDSPRVLRLPGGHRRRGARRGDRHRRRGIRSAFKKAGKSAGRGGKRFGQNVARGRVVRGGKEFGKGMGGFGKHTGKGVGRTMRRVFKP